MKEEFKRRAMEIHAEMAEVLEEMEKVQEPLSKEDPQAFPLWRVHHSLVHLASAIKMGLQLAERAPEEYEPVVFIEGAIDAFFLTAQEYRGFFDNEEFDGKKLQPFAPVDKMTALIKEFKLQP